MLPGDTHDWIIFGFDAGAVFSLAAHPVVGDPYAGERILEVTGMSVEGDTSGRRLYFSINNAGGASIPGYAICVSITTP